METTAAPAIAAREHSENFPVALRFLPGPQRRDLHALYAFARTVDELGDSASGDRTALLQRFDAKLERVWSGGPLTDPVLVGLRAVVATHELSAEPFHRLVQANLADQHVTGYATFEDLLGYCHLSAEPIGEMVLGVFGAGDPDLLTLSNRVCTALQLLEHWQDVGEDRRVGRIYLPRDDMDRFGVPETALDLPTATPELAALMRFEIERAARWLEDGSPIVGVLHGWARPCVAGFVAGGRATVAALRRTRGDVLARSARPSRAGTAARLLAAVAVAAMRRRDR